MKIFSILTALGALALCGSPPSLAHVTLEHPVAHAASHYKANFKIGHGCGPSPTRQFVVTVPAGVTHAKPMPKPGWQLSITREPATALGQERMLISWTAQTPADFLADEHYAEFTLVARLPDRVGPLYWPVSQICPDGRLDWHQTPSLGQGRQALQAPAPELDVIPSVGHTHTH